MAGPAVPDPRADPATSGQAPLDPATPADPATSGQAPSAFPLPAPPRAERLVPGLTPAGWWRRLLSAFVDSVIRLALYAAPLTVGAVLLTTAGDLAGGIALAIAIPVALVLLNGYGPFLIARYGWTVGDRLASVRVLRSDGSRLDGGVAFVREFVVKSILFGMVGVFVTFGIATLLNYLWPLWDERSQALHDKIVGTVVVRA